MLSSELDPGRRGKELVGKGLYTLRAILASMPKTSHSMFNTSISTILKGNPSNEIYDNLKILLKNWGGQFYKENPLNEICENLKFLLNQVRREINFTNEIPLNKMCENLTFAQKVKRGSILRKKSL